MKTVRILLSGIVQGVGFRYFAYRKAKKMGVTGYVRNLSDGRVEVVAEAEDSVLEDFINEIENGPPFAYVSKMELEELTPMHFDTFEIKY